MNDEQIVKALECCINPDSGTCSGCPLEENNHLKLCIDIMTQNALDLINRQKAEMEKALATIDGLEAEIERLKRQNGRLEYAFVAECELSACSRKKEIRDEAIKEFAKEFVADLSHMLTYDKNYIKAKIFKLVEEKEMAGELE